MSDSVGEIFGTGKGSLGTFKDPFTIDTVEEIRFRIGKPLFGGPVTYTAVIEFKNGSTTGEHRIQAANFPLLVDAVEEFVKGLRQK